MKKIIIFLTSLVFSLAGKAQQDPQYNLYQFNQMVINPAFAGSRDGLSAIAATRQQWSFSGAPQTTCLSLHGPVLKKNIGLGLTVVNDVMGPRNIVGVYGNFAYIAKINSQTRLSFGINAGYNRYQFNFSKIIFENADAMPAEFLANQNRGTLDINSGLYLRSGSFFVGLSATHINTPKVYTYEAVLGTDKYSYKLRTHMFLTLGKSFIINQNLIFAPTALVKLVGNTTGADLNLNFFLYKKLWLGAFYRNGYGPGALIQYYITNNFRVAYSYDTGLNAARGLGASHEVMLGFDFAVAAKARMVNPRFL